MARVTLAREWVVRGAYGLDAAIERAARQQGLTVSRSAGGLELRGGSQLKLRASGSLFARDDFLPRRGVVATAPSRESTAPSASRCCWRTRWDSA